MATGQTDAAAHGYNFDEAAWFYWDWIRRDPAAGYVALVREARAGTYKGMPLCERVSAYIAAEHQRSVGNWTEEFTLPQRPARFERRREVRYEGKGAAKVTQPAAPQPRAVTPPAPRVVARQAIPQRRG